MNRRGDVSGVVLAGGAGRRLGVPKAGVVLEGRTLVEHAVDALVGRCREVVVVSRPGVPLPLLSVPVIHDRPGPDAPLVAIATGLAAITGDQVLVLACDLPFASAAIDALLEVPDDVACVATACGRVQPLCVRYPRLAALAAANALLSAGLPRARGLVGALLALHVEVPPASLLNVNDPTDLAYARARAGGAPHHGGPTYSPSMNCRDDHVSARG